MSAFLFSEQIFLRYLVLENINSVLSRYRSSGDFALSKSEFGRMLSLLFDWHTAHRVSSSSGTDDRLQLIALWHNFLISTLINVILIESVVGKGDRASSRCCQQDVIDGGSSYCFPFRSMLLTCTKLFGKRRKGTIISQAGTSYFYGAQMPRY